MLLNYNVINDFIAAVNSNTLEAYIKKNGPYVAPEEVEVQALNNYQSFPLTIDHETDMLTGDEDFLTLIKGGHLKVSYKPRWGKGLGTAWNEDTCQPD